MPRSAFPVFPVLLFTLIFAGCDYANTHVADGERADRLYQTAMEEYTAGRLDKSIEIFQKVLKTNPGNASARFQLACLLQDHRKDPLGAICNYREYVALVPEGDKVQIARERMAVCERQLAVLLVKKHNLGGSVEQDEANQRLRADNAKLTADLETMTKDVDKLKADLAASRRENERIRRMVLADDVEPSTAGGVSSQVAAKPTAAERKMPEMPDERDLLEDDATVVDRVKFSSDVANLISEEKEETSQAAPFGNTVRKAAEQKPVEPQGPMHEKRPECYVVQEGDTLFKLAMRFYGRRSAWTLIRDANKAVVSSDGRIKAGDKLRLP